MRQYAPDLCSANDMAYLIGMKPTEFKKAVSGGFLPRPLHQPGTAKEVWDRQAVLDMVRSQNNRQAATNLSIMEAAGG